MLLVVNLYYKANEQIPFTQIKLIRYRAVYCDVLLGNITCARRSYAILTLVLRVDSVGDFDDRHFTIRSLWFIFQYLPLQSSSSKRSPCF